MIDTVIFDMDGVLIDSVGAAHRAKTELLARRGIDVNTIPDPHNENHRGTSVRTLLKAVEEQHGLKIDEEEFGREATNLVFKNLREDDISADPALIKFLEELRQRAITCAITTSGIKPSVENKLRILDIQKYFTLIVTADDVAQHKPNPAAYLYTMEHLNVRPDHCIIFEDSAAGIEAGRTAGGIVIGYGGYLDHNKPLPGTRATIQGWGEVSYASLLEITAQA